VPGQGAKPTLKAVDGVSPGHPARRDPWPWWARTGFGQDHLRPNCCWACTGRPAATSATAGRASWIARKPGRAGRTPPGTGRVPRSVLLAQPDHDHRPVAGRGAQGPPGWWTAASGPARVAELLSTVGLSASQAAPAPVCVQSGGERQRIGQSARALAVQPEVVIADEPLVRPGRVDPGAGAEPDDPAARRTRA